MNDSIQSNEGPEGFTPLSEGPPPLAEEYAVEFNTRIAYAQQETYDIPDQNPFEHTYRELARMVVLCQRMYIGLRSAEERVNDLLASVEFSDEEEQPDESE